jgi:hypothetical protein
MENNERNNMRPKDHGFGKEHDELLLKMREAEQSGNPIEAARLSMEILKIRREAGNEDDAAETKVENKNITDEGGKIYNDILINLQLAKHALKNNKEVANILLDYQIERLEKLINQTPEEREQEELERKKSAEEHMKRTGLPF